MTIISVVWVPEGIAMTADSRLLGTYTRDNGVVERFTFSDNAQKLLLIRNSIILFPRPSTDNQSKKMAYANSSWWLMYQINCR
jgi:hypothetical protein